MTSLAKSWKPLLKKHFWRINRPKKRLTNMPGTITRLEEERIQAYFGGGSLYGLPGRAEPLI